MRGPSLAPAVVFGTDATFLVVKLFLTPLLIGALSLAARKYGHAVGGWLVGLPLTSGPVSVFLALEQGAAFAAEAAAAMIAGVIAVAAFSLAYSHVSKRRPWPVSLGAGLLAFAVVAGALAQAPLPLLPVVGATVTVLVAAQWWLPARDVDIPTPTAPRFDIPFRMLAATGVVFALTALAGVLGPAWTGVLSPFPVFTAVLGAFTHAHAGPEAARTLMRGLTLGLFSFVAFFLVVGLLLVPQGMALTYVLATLVAVSVNGLAWIVLHRRAPGVDLVPD